MCQVNFLLKDMQGPVCNKSVKNSEHFLYMTEIFLSGTFNHTNMIRNCKRTI